MSWILNQSSCIRNQHNFYLRLFFFLLYDSDLLPPLYTDAWSMVVIFALAGEAIQNWRWRGVVDSTGWNPLPSRSVQVNWSCCLWGRGSAVFISGMSSKLVLPMCLWPWGSFDDACFRTEQNNNRTQTWLYRLGGWLAMFLGLTLLRWLKDMRMNLLDDCLILCLILT